MDDFSEKLRGILSDEESLRQISELAQMFTSGSFESAETNSESNSASGSSSADTDFSGLFSSLGSIDPSLILKISSLAANASSDNSAQLLTALRPLIKEERREKLDKAAKILKLLAIYTAAKQSGLLEGLGSLL